MTGQSPAMLAVSDLLVLTALERSWARAVKRGRYACPPAARHSQYLRVDVGETQIDGALRDAWALLPVLAVRHDLDVDPVRWAELLDQYTRALLLMRQPHSPQRLAKVLALLDVEQTEPRTLAGR